MKKTILLSLCLVLQAGYNYSQSITAGNTTAGGCFIDVAPDLALEPGGANFQWTFDINCDGIDDFKLLTISSTTSMTSNKAVSLIPLNGAEIASDSIYHCTMTGSNVKTIHAYNDGDAIPGASGWVNSYAQLYWVDVQPTGYCAGHTFDAPEKYIGVRVPKPTGYVYGWIKVNNVTSTKVTLMEYASSTLVVGLDETVNNAAISVFPNPVNESITINWPGNTAPLDLTVSDISGKTVYAAQNIQAGHAISISSLPAGIYTAVVSNSTTRAMHKLVKQ